MPEGFQWLLLGLSTEIDELLTQECDTVASTGELRVSLAEACKDGK